MPKPRAGRPLQWGHDLAVMESGSSFTRTTNIDALQWGHDLAVMESMDTELPYAEDGPLQWGHDLAVMESRRRTRFPETSPRSLLQWGHDLAVMERGSPPTRRSA